MERNGIEIDIFDAMRAPLNDDVDLDDRRAVECALDNSDPDLALPDDYRSDPKTFARYIDICIRSAKANKAAGIPRRDGRVMEGFVLMPYHREETDNACNTD